MRPIVALGEHTDAILRDLDFDSPNDRGLAWRGRDLKKPNPPREEPSYFHAE